MPMCCTGLPSRANFFLEEFHIEDVPVVVVCLCCCHAFGANHFILRQSDYHCQIEMLAYDWHWRYSRILSAEFVLTQNQIKCHRKYEWKFRVLLFENATGNDIRQMNEQREIGYMHFVPQVWSLSKMRNPEAYSLSLSSLNTETVSTKRNNSGKHHQKASFQTINVAVFWKWRIGRNGIETIGGADGANKR